MQKWQAGWLLVVVALVLIMPSGASAQDGIALETLSLEFLPEYDAPGMLVIQRFRLPEDIRLPVELTFQLPASARLHVAAFEQDGELYYAASAPPMMQAGVQLVAITIEKPFEYRLEYYLPIERFGKTRRFEYQWPGEYAVRQMLIGLKVPEDAQDVVVSPGLTKDGDLLTGNLGAFQSGETFSLKIKYQRESDSVQIAGEPVTAPQPLVENIQWPERMLVVWPWALAVLGVVLIVGGGVYYWLSGRGRKPAEHKKHKDAGGSFHCHQCGQRAQAGDKFCRACGTRLRREG
jgi:hypothetical protein